MGINVAYLYSASNKYRLACFSDILFISLFHNKYVYSYATAFLIFALLSLHIEKIYNNFFLKLVKMRKKKI